MKKMVTRDIHDQRHTGKYNIRANMLLVTET
jgi:hypothetical protein